MLKQFLTSKRRSKKVSNPLAQQHQSISSGKPLQRYQLHQDNRREGEAAGEEQAKRRGGDRQHHMVRCEVDHRDSGQTTEN